MLAKTRPKCLGHALNPYLYLEGSLKGAVGSLISKLKEQRSFRNPSPLRDMGLEMGKGMLQAIQAGIDPCQATPKCLVLGRES